MVAARCFQEERELAYGASGAPARRARSRGAGTDGGPALAGRGGAAAPASWAPPRPGRSTAPAAQARFFDAVSELLDAGRGAAAGAVLSSTTSVGRRGLARAALSYSPRRLGGRPRARAADWRAEPVRRVPARLRRGPPRQAAGGSTARCGRDRPGRGVGRARDTALAESGGLPFLLVEYLELASARTTDESPPGGVRELLSARLARSARPAAQVIAAAAVIGRAFDADTVRARQRPRRRGASGRSRSSCARGVLVRDGRHDYEFRHEQLRRLVARARRGSRGVGSCTAAWPPRSPGPARAAVVARHLALAGRDAEAAAAYRLAGDQARALSPTPRRSPTYRAALAARLSRAGPAARGDRRPPDASRAITAPRWPATRRPPRSPRRRRRRRSSTGIGQRPVPAARRVGARDAALAAALDRARGRGGRARNAPTGASSPTAGGPARGRRAAEALALAEAGRRPRAHGPRPATSSACSPPAATRQPARARAGARPGRVDDDRDAAARVPR